MKCDGCGLDNAKYVLWVVGTKNKHPSRKGGLRLRNPIAVCENCLPKFSGSYEIVHEVKQGKLKRSD